MSRDSDSLAALLEKAIAIALRAHEGQTDRSGNPYVLHPLHLMDRMDTPVERMAAVLHDVVEDTETTISDLQAAGFPEEVTEAVRLLTHDKSTLSYEQYVRRLRHNDLARKIKLADLEHNMDIRRAEQVEEDDLVRLQKYREAWRVLTE
ncbi:MAG: hypothetical protein R3272_04605 [Candidatus Promineifilaceae bacterium]|nr:hypothetical protein [Candidatus Promineifilaceae bacterium]